HLGERECSLQRRHQKLVEESPSAVVTPQLREKMGKTAVRAAKAAHYVGVGTIEFLLDRHQNFFFMEMNTRIQVEHPVTEMVTGVDLIKQQIKMHAGEKFPDFLRKIQLRGHAIECRINAEDPAARFAPSPGTITAFHMPGGKGVRVDSHAYAGYQIPTYYDSLIGKLIVHAHSRERAINRMRQALEECIIEGVKTTIPYHQAIMATPEFCRGDFDTSFLEQFHFQPKE
ncbi:MAG: acetyl-CoA carboxylase biotin carboxylase subunit, partial [Candidatus Neomarinimicrobiota bacterium]